MNISHEGYQIKHNNNNNNKTLFSPNNKAALFISPRPSPVLQSYKSSISSPAVKQAQAQAQAQAQGGTRQQPKNSSTSSSSSLSCCSPFNDCLGMGSTHSRANNLHTDRERGQRENKTQLEKMQCFLSRQIPSPAVLPRHKSNLATVIDQAKTKGWYIEPHEIEFKERVGRGTTADIYRGSWKGLDVAVKCIYPNFFLSNPDGVSFFIQELETLSQQKHPLVLRLIGACLDPPEHGWMVTEFLSMTLKQWLHGDEGRRRERSVPLPAFEDRVAKALEIAEAMQYLHEKNPRLLHRDLKPSNIFMDDSMHVRIADFGHARFLQEEEKALTGETGTYVYMAPEVIRCEPYNEKCDVYSYGVILNELITGEHPYIETDYGPIEIALEVGEGNLRPKLPEEDDDDNQLRDIIDLIQRSWDEDTSIRPSFVSIVSTLKEIQERFIISV